MKFIRKNMGTIIAAFGFLLICVITFGDLAEIMTEKYWLNVLENLTSIGLVTVSLTMIQVSIKQGISEQALQRGLNTPFTTQKWGEHKECIAENQRRIIFMPYFLQIYNERQTILKKREFLVNNNFPSEAALIASRRNRLIKKYKHIRIYLTVNRIKWSPTDIVYNKHGQITTLSEYRSQRMGKGIIMGVLVMLGLTLLTYGLFMDPTEVPFWVKIIKLGTYIITIAMTSVYSVLKNYEKGSIGVPNELDELNGIWNEFKIWETPAWILDEVKELNYTVKEVAYEKGNIPRETVQEQPPESQMVRSPDPDLPVALPGPSSIVLSPNIQPVDVGSGGLNLYLQHQAEPRGTNPPPAKSGRKVWNR